ncbi:MAG TPA: GntR family transcriptional regulator [Rhizomicrobium sp.]
MNDQWDDNQPIYRQLRDRVVAMILDGVLKEGDPLPSVRTIAAENRVNPMTVLKAWQQLADEDLVEKRRGLGMYVRANVQAPLLAAERRKFLETQWPPIRQNIRRLDLSLLDLSLGELLAPGATAGVAPDKQGKR